MRANQSAFAAAALFGGVLMATSAPAQQGGSAQWNAIAACGTIAKKSARLACYDAQTQGGQTQGTAPSALPPERNMVAPSPLSPPATAPVAAAPPQPAAPVPTFGSEGLPRGRATRARDVKQVTAHVAGAVDDGIGHWTVTLDTGERWKMTESSSTFVPPRVGDELRIRKGALGGYLMDLNRQASVRVMRVQ